ncbi:MAG TPA: hypothetical protein PKK15_13725, partial [Kouleothrix sp.]|nr:hypothetical protein [Kouleothrix sp.]
AFGERGIGLRSLTEAIDTTTAGGTLVFHIFALTAPNSNGASSASAGRSVLRALPVAARDHRRPCARSRYVSARNK